MIPVTLAIAGPDRGILLGEKMAQTRP